ncbi:BTAD domain-containing putative transcriptional regulator [Actinoplanes sp. TFC3]|uniref:AfsR/SARP family transcriptional regulator n=1 Tax=Actinoplanes sp. TFC3 TaxID=1710355 RepID=UPI0012907FEA|nr:BTAD domain-containing putative transcriptional regulator [Actinoplanes sp. TFC3]
MLGPVRVWRGSDEVPLGPAKQRAVLALLALHAGVGVPMADLQDGVWGAAAPGRANQLIHTYIARLRQILEPDAPRRRRTGVIASTESGYMLCVEPHESDVAVFRSLVRQAGQYHAAHHNISAFLLLKEALKLWEDPSLSEMDTLLHRPSDLVDLQSSWTEAARRYVALGLGMQRAEEVLSTAQQLILIDPLDERGQAHFLTALQRAGRRTAALRHYSEVRELLRHELGVEPGTALRSAYRRLLASPAGYSAAPAAPDDHADGSGPPVALLHRDNELHALLAMLDTQRLITVTGPPGAGKSLLIRHALARITESGARVIAADVADLLDRAELMTWLAREGLSPGERIWLVLDNAEHLTDACALLAVQQFPQWPGVSLLIGSREPVGLPGEAVLRLTPLGIPTMAARSTVASAPAAELFLRRAAEAQPGFRLSKVNALHVREVCHRLDGLPLALELAAACLADEPLPALVRRLDRPLADLAPARLLYPGRHWSVRGMLNRSLATLNGAERWLISRLACLPPDFGLEALARIGAPPLRRPVDVADLLTRLVRKSLLLAEPAGATPRFRQLTVVRKLAAELCASEDGVIDGRDQYFSIM